MGKRTLSFLLALVMVFGLIPAVSAPALAVETEQSAETYQALVANDIVVDGTLNETSWYTTGKLSGGQAFDILWDGGNLYFAVAANEADTALTVKVGGNTLLTAEKAEGASAIEASAFYITNGVTAIENVTLSVGESTWTGTVELVKKQRYLVPISAFKTAGTVTKSADGTAATLSLAPAEAAAAVDRSTLYATEQPFMVTREGDTTVKFTFSAENLPITDHYNSEGGISIVGSSLVSWASPAFIISDGAGEALYFGIWNTSDNGLILTIHQTGAYIKLDKTLADGAFDLELVWTQEETDALTVYVDGELKGTTTNVTKANDSMGDYKNDNMMAVIAMRHKGAAYGYYNQAIDFTVSNYVLEKAAEVTYASNPPERDGEVTALFAAAAPTLESTGWTNAGWESFQAGNGKVSALINNGNVYVAVKEAGEGTVAVTVGEKTASAELVDGAALVCVEAPGISLYGQELALQVAVNGTNAWAEGTLIVGQKLAGAATVLPATDGVIKSGLVTTDAATNSFTITSTTASPMYDNSHSAYWINNKASFNNSYDMAFNNLLEQVIRVDKMPVGEATGHFNGTSINQAWGYEVMFETPSAVTAGQYDYYACVIYPDADGNLFLRAMNSEAAEAEPVALGKKLEEEFKLGLLLATDGSMTVYVDGAEIAALNSIRRTQGKVYGSALMLKYMDPVTQTEGNAEASMTIKDVTVTTMGTKDLINLEDEIVAANIFKGVDLKAVKADLPLPTTFQSAYLGEHTLTWKSSDESIVENNGTIHPNLTKEKKATLSVYLDDATTALWSVEVVLPATAVVLNALLSETEMVIDGELREAAWLDWEKFDAVAGNIAAAWTKGYLYLAVHSAEGESLKLEINGKAAVVDLVNGTVSGYANAKIAKNAETGEIEIAIPLGDIDFNLTDYNQTVSLKAELVKGETVATLEAILLNFSGDIAELRALANYTKDNGPWTLLTNSIGYNGTTPGKVNYVYKINNNLDHTDTIVLSNEFCFEVLPITTGAYKYTDTQADGFYYYFGDESETTRVGSTIAGAIFTEDGTNLKLRISAGKDKEGTVIELNKTLGETFRLTHVWYADNTLDLYVDGVLVGTVANAALTTSYLGIDVITYRYYSERATGEKVKFTLSNQTWATVKYENVKSELTPNVVFGRTDLDHVQADLPMVTSFASANFSALNLKWTTSDPSVVTADGKVTRHATEAKSAVVTVFFVDSEGNEDELWSVTITVDPMSVTKQPAPAIIHTGFVAPGAIVLDNALTTEENWLLNGWVLDDAQQPAGYFGVQWAQENLYVALNTAAESVVLNINGKTFNVTMNGEVTEVEIPVADLGLEKITEYGKTMPITVTIGDATYEGTLMLTNVGFWGADNFFAALPMLANNVKSVKYGTADTPDGNQGAKQLTNGWRVYDLYGGEDAANPAGIRTYILFMKMPVYENFADRTEATHLEFDFYAKSLPVWEWDEAIAKDSIARAFATYGVTFSLSDKADSAKNSNVAVFGIVNTTEGLVFVVNRGAGDYLGIPLNKQVGEEFRLGLTWQTNSDMVIWIDGEVYETVNGLSRWVNAVGDTSFVVNMLRNKQKPTSEADNMDVYLTNIAFGKAHATENIIRNLTFATICGENEKEDGIESDLILPAYMTNGQLEHQYPITWESSDPATIDPATGKVTRPVTGVKAVTLTATLDNNGTKEVKEFSLLVLGESVSNGNVLVVTDDTNPFAKGAVAYGGLLFNLDKTNNSVVYAIPEDAEVTKTNLVVLTDLDAVARLNRESLRLFVSNDNVTYTEIENYKLHHDGCNWYLYGFETDAKYIKAHYTHRDNDDTNFVNTPGEMIHVYWNDGLVIPADAAEIAVPATTLRDQAVAIALPEGVKAEGLRVALNGEILFHYVDKDGAVYVRIADPTTGVLKLWNASDIELADKENVYEVTYGTRETLPTGGRWVMSVKAGTTFPDGSVVEVDTLYNMNSKSVSKSTDGGYTWTGVGSIVIDGTGLSSGGWGIDSKTGRMFHESYGDVTFNETDITKSHLITYVHYSDDGGKTWTLAKGLGQIEGDLQTMYVLSYTDITELAGNDGEGPNVDFVFPMGAQFNNNGAFCGRVAYTTDGGLSWQYSESKITFGNETAFEGGVSEATILEREDGTLVYYARCQSSGVDNFTISYSLDHGVTWLTPGAKSSIYTTNTQALMMTYDFGGFDGNRTTGSPIFMWGGNNVMGGNSYIRNPLNFAVSTNEMDTFRNIQNIFFETFMEEYKTTHYITNASIQQINGDNMYVTFSRLKHGDSVYMVVNNFTDWFTRTKGAYDSFEHGTAQYEGWITVKGGAEATKAQASEGNYSMLIKANSQVTRSIPYLQNGVLTLDLYVDAKSAFTFELQPAFAAVANKCAVISAEVNGTTMTLNDGTELTLKEGWNTVAFDLALTENQIAISVNGGEAKAVAANLAVGNYIGYITFLPTADVYVDEFFVESALDAEVEATEADKAAADEVIELIKAIGEVTEGDEEDAAAIAAARAAYDALTQVQKDLVNRNVRISDEDTAITDGDLSKYMVNYYDVLREAEKALLGVLLGDADGNGVINTLDAMLILQYYTGAATDNDIVLAACDLDGNGVINTVDAMLVLQYYTGAIEKFPVEN